MANAYKMLPRKDQRMVFGAVADLSEELISRVLALWENNNKHYRDAD